MLAFVAVVGRPSLTLLGPFSLFALVVVCMAFFVDSLSRGRLFVCRVFDGAPHLVLLPLCTVVFFLGRLHSDVVIYLFVFVTWSSFICHIRYFGLVSRFEVVVICLHHFIRSISTLNERCFRSQLDRFRRLCLVCFVS